MDREPRVGLGTRLLERPRMVPVLHDHIPKGSVWFLLSDLGVWKWVRGLWELASSLYSVGPKDQTQVVRLGDRLLYPLSSQLTFILVLRLQLYPLVLFMLSRWNQLSPNFKQYLGNSGAHTVLVIMGLRMP